MALRKNAFIAMLICIVVLLAGCSTEMNRTDTNTDSKGAEISVGESKNQAEQYTVNTKISDVTNDPVFEDYGRLIFPVNSAYYSGDTLG